MSKDFFDSDDFKNLNEESKKALKNLLESNNFLKNELKNSFNGQPGLFVHDLNDNGFNEKMELFIRKYNMKQQINIRLDHELADKVIEEVWMSEDGLIKMKRFYELNYENINLLRPESRQMVHNLLLDEAIKKEDYEKAAEIRDSIYLNE